MTILIVDDDVPTVQAICELIEWDALGISEVVCAYDFAEAKQKVQSTAPQIILCDIEMPKGSGVELLQWLRQEGIDAEFIFLTCHESFEYAQAALRYQAADYITKPFDVQSIQTVLVKVISRVRYQEKAKQESEAAVRWQDGHKLAQQSFLHKFALGHTRMEPRVLDERLAGLGMQLRSDSSCMLVLVASHDGNTPAGWEKELFQYAVRNLVLDLIAQMDETCVLTYSSNESMYDLVVLPAPDECNMVLAQCKKLCAFAQEYLGSQLTCYYFEKTAFFDIPKVRSDMEQVDVGNVAHRGEVLPGWAAETQPASEPVGVDVELIERLFLQEKVSEIVTTIQALLRRLSEQNRLDSAGIQCIQQDLLQVMYTVLGKNDIQAHRLFADETARRLRKNASASVFDMVKWVSFSADWIVREIRMRKKDQSVSGQIQQFIHEHYMEPIGRDEVAAFVYLTPDYANRIFKNEQDISIKEYLNQYRIKQAKKMLLEGVSVSEVAEKTGFINFSYFSTVFKKYAGCSPSEYKRMSEAE